MCIRDRYEGKALDHNTLRSINAFIIVYFIILGVSVLLVSLDNFDFGTSFSAVVATLNNIGPCLLYTSLPCVSRTCTRSACPT